MISRVCASGGPGGGAAVDRQHDAGDLRGAFARQERDGVGDVGRLRLAFERLHVLDHRTHVVVGDAAADVRRRQAVDPDAVRGEIDRHALGGVGDRRLRRAVGDHPGAGVDGRDRRVVDDRTAAVILHVARRPLRADDDAEQVDVHDPLEVVEVVGQESLESAADPGVVEHDVQPAEAFDRDVDECLHLIGVAHVGSLERRPFAQRRGDRLALLDVDVGDDHARPFGDQQFGGCLADGAGAAGHDRTCPANSWPVSRSGGAVLCPHGHILRRTYYDSEVIVLAGPLPIEMSADERRLAPHCRRSTAAAEHLRPRHRHAGLGPLPNRVRSRGRGGLPGTALRGMAEWLDAFVPFHDTCTWTFHVMTNHLVGHDSGGVWASCYGDVRWQLDASVDRYSHALGMYQDRLVAVDGGWIVAHRKFRMVMYRPDIPLPDGMAFPTSVHALTNEVTNGEPSHDRLTR